MWPAGITVAGMRTALAGSDGEGRDSLSSARVPGIRGALGPAAGVSRFRFEAQLSALGPICRRTFARP